jgi:alkyl hydroperoxide reductase subunit AhpF
MNNRGFDDNTAILDELLDMSPRIGIANLGLLCRIEPNFTFTDAGDGGGESFLGAKIDHSVICLVLSEERQT